jgi:hypothetical protein
LKKNLTFKNKKPMPRKIVFFGIGFFWDLEPQQQDSEIFPQKV